MDVLPDSINPNFFPAKLWRLVNSPANTAIRWDSLGELIVIDQQLFEKQILSPDSNSSDSPDAFRTTTFSSFIRQLNLYGFRKVPMSLYNYFYNPNFKRNHPECLKNLRRLTIDNKAKLQAGPKVNSRPPPQNQRRTGSGSDGGDKNVKRESSLLVGPTHQGSSHPYYLNTAQTIKGYDRTPVPPQFLMRGHSVAHSPTVFAVDKEISVSLSRHYTGAASSPDSVHIQQGLSAPANHGNPIFPPNAQYQPGYCTPVCQYYHPNPVTPPMAGGGTHTGLFSPQTDYQAGYPLNMFYHGDHSKDFQNNDQEVENSDINLDLVFQIADELMPMRPSYSVVQVETPEKPVSVLEPSSNTSC